MSNRTSLGLGIIAIVAGGLMLNQFFAEPAVTQSFGATPHMRVLFQERDKNLEAGELYKEFASSVYFGAFAVGNDDRMGYWAGANDIESARFYAMEFCNDGALVDVSGCKLYAELRPFDFIPTDQPTINHVSYRRFQDLIQSNQPHTAMAVSGAGHFGYTYAYDTQIGANKGAMALCNKQLLEDPVMQPSKNPCFLVLLAE